MIAGQATDRITLGTEVTGEAALWAPRCDGSLLVVTAADARPLYRFLVEEASAAGWGIFALSAGRAPEEEAAGRPFAELSGEIEEQEQLLHQVRELIEARFIQHERAGLTVADPGGFTPVLVAAGSLEALQRGWADAGRSDLLATGTLLMETVLEYGARLNVHLFATVANREHGLTAQDGHLSILTPLAAGLPPEWETAGAKEGGCAVLRTKSGEQRLLRLGLTALTLSSRPLTHAG